MTEISDSLEALLVRQGMRGNGAGTPALHAMEWANALLDREDEEIEPMHSPAGGEEDRRNENSEAGAAKAPARARWDTAHFQPSPGRHTRPVLLLVHCSSRRRPARYDAGPRLVLIVGGKS